jgi:hypothetical protein
MSANKDADGLAELRVLGDDIPETDETAKARARSRLDHAISSESVASPTPLWWWVAVAAAIVALSIATPLFLWRGTDRPVAEPGLMRLAAVASRQFPPSVPAGSFVYTLSRVQATSTETNITTGQSGIVDVVSRRETWIARDGSGLVLQRPIRPASAKAERTEAGPGTLRFASLDNLPTEPDALLDAILGPGFLDQPEDDVELFSRISQLLRDSFVSPAHREALFRIVESIEGVQVEEDHRDPLGRLGTAVTLRDSTRSVTLVFEPRTSRLLAEREARPDGTFFEATYLESAVVEAIGERPDVAAS